MLCRVASLTVIALLLSFGTAAAARHQSRHVKQLTYSNVPAALFLYAVDQISSDKITVSNQGAGGVLRLPQGPTMTVLGWAVLNGPAKQLVRSVSLVLDGKQTYRGHYSLSRSDVANAFHAPQVGRSGFSVNIPTRALGFGTHSIDLAIESKSSVKRFLSRPLVRFALYRNAVSTRRIGFSMDLLAYGKRVVRGPALAHSPEIPTGVSVTVQGWAVDPERRSVAKGVLVSLDGRVDFQAKYGLPRPDVAKALHVAAYRNSGFSAVIPAGYLLPGSHFLRLKIVARDGTGVGTSSLLASFRARA